MSSTYKDIQRITGYSLGTISKYFNGGSLRAKTKKDIEAAVARLDYRVNGFARGLKSRKSMTIGLLIPEINGIFATTILRLIVQFFRQRGYSCLICDCDSDTNIEVESLDFLLDKMVDGIITIPTDTSGKHLERAHTRNIPVVLVDRKVDDFDADTVVIDNYSAGKTAAEYLRDFGHVNVAVISGTQDVYTMKQRCSGFVDAFSQLRKSTFTKKNNVRVMETNLTVESGYIAAKDLLTNDNNITAIFCANYELTLGTIMAMKELGIKYPAGTSLFGFDNIEIVRTLSPSITLMAQPMELLAQSASNLLLERLEHGSIFSPKTIMLDTTLIEGNSVSNLFDKANQMKDGLAR
ncbi:MAG: LacI family transcriptional regulator [Defluviitaleaceae bacterium]|nr:LacI family transcriptional regulator [Defluviitaleaceae bacterium]